MKRFKPIAAMLIIILCICTSIQPVLAGCCYTRCCSYQYRTRLLESIAYRRTMSCYSRCVPCYTTVGIGGEQYTVDSVTSYNNGSSSSLYGGSAQLSGSAQYGSSTQYNGSGQYTGSGQYNGSSSGQYGGGFSASYEGSAGLYKNSNSSNNY